jgi:hypothetical protein
MALNMMGQLTAPYLMVGLVLAFVQTTAAQKV